jgi:SOS-response transcriptional repressor LexA
LVELAGFRKKTFIYFTKGFRAKFRGSFGGNRMPSSRFAKLTGQLSRRLEDTMIRAISKNGVPEWSKHIESVRARLGMSQSQLAQELQYSPMAVSRWERGIQEPPADCYIKLGKLVGGEDRWFFWERAGLTKMDVQDEGPQRKAVSNFEVVLAGAAAKKDVAQKIQLVAIPLLRVHAGTHGEGGDHVRDLSHAPQEEVIAAPVAWCPHPDTTTCLRVKGKSMTPLIYDGDIVAVDSSVTKHSVLNDKIVVAWHKNKGLSISRFRHVDSVELLESDNRDYQPIALTGDRSWQIVGKVLWLIRQTM